MSYTLNSTIYPKKGYKKSCRTVGFTGYSGRLSAVPANFSSCCEKTQVGISYTSSIIGFLISIAREFLHKIRRVL